MEFIDASADAVEVVLKSMTMWSKTTMLKLSYDMMILLLCFYFNLTKVSSRQQHL